MTARQLAFAEFVAPAGVEQRWRAHTHAWRHRTEGGFDRGRYRVAPIAETDAKRFVVGHHYSGTYPAAQHRVGLFDDAGVLVGVAVFAVPVQQAVLTRTFPALEPYRESCELARFVLLDEVPGNAESWFLARCFDLLRPVGVRGVVSHSDPVARSIGGRVVFAGHVGTIYQASNASYLGRTAPRTVILLPDGSVLNARSVEKLRSGDRGHEYVERRLVGLGACPRVGVSPDAWLTEALDVIGARRVRHGGCHRYAFRLDRGVKVGRTSEPYPKRADR